MTKTFSPEKIEEIKNAEIIFTLEGDNPKLIWGADLLRETGGSGMFCFIHEQLTDEEIEQVRRIKTGQH